MIDYSIKKPHALCGHFIQINTQEEYDELKAIAEGCGFVLHGILEEGSYYRFENGMRIVWHDPKVKCGQQVTMSELRQLAELSKIELPCEMEVSDDGYAWCRKMVVGFYKGLPMREYQSECFISYKHFRLDPQSKRKAELVKIIDMAKKELEELNGGKV